MNLTKGDIVLAYLYVFFIGGVIALSSVLGSKSGGALEAHADSQPKTEIAFSDPNILAKAAVVYDVKERRFIYQKNDTAQLPIASLTKLATAFVAANESPLDQTISVDPKALTEEGDSGLFANEKWNLGALINLTLVSSSNDGAAAIARALSTSTPFVDTMNKTVQALGLSQTYFLNPTGLDVSSTTSGGYSSAHDVSLLLYQILQKYPSLLEETNHNTISVTSGSGFVHTAKNTNQSVDEEPSIIASKTGLTDLAGGNLAVAFDAGPDRPMIAVVLGSTETGRFADIHALIQNSFAFLTATH